MMPGFTVKTASLAKAPRVEWESEVVRLIEEEGVTTSDAQGILEAHEGVADDAYRQGESPKTAAERIMAVGPAGEGG